jgi:hypothetical protein
MDFYNLVDSDEDDQQTFVVDNKKSKVKRRIFDDKGLAWLEKKKGTEMLCVQNCTSGNLIINTLLQ